MSKLYDILKDLENEGWSLSVFDFQTELRVVAQKDGESFVLSTCKTPPADVVEWCKRKEKTRTEVGALFG